MAKQFDADVERGLEPLVDLENIETVVGIPFYDEDDTLPGVVQTACLGLAQTGLADKALVVCVGPDGSLAALDAALTRSGPDHGVRVHGFLHSRGLGGRGCCNRALLVVAARFGASLILLPPDLTPQPYGADLAGQGFSPGWFPRLLSPVHDHKQDLALPHFSHDPLARTVESLFAYPVITGVYGFRLRQPTPGVFALSPRLVHSCLAANQSWALNPGTYGFDPWLISHTLAEGFAICEVPLGAAAFQHRIGKIKTAFRQIAHVLFDQILEKSKWWLKRSDPVTSPSFFGPSMDVLPARIAIDPKELLRRFKYEFNHFDNVLLCRIVSDDLRERMERLADRGPNGVALTAEEWTGVLSDFLLAFKFEKKFHRDDIVDAIFPFFLARLASFIYQLRTTEDELISGGQVQSSTAGVLVRLEAERLFERQADLFVADWPRFRDRWHEREAEAESYLPMLGAWEFVPHVGVIVPQELETPDGGLVFARDVYQEQIDRYRLEFTQFLQLHLGLENVASSTEILTRVQTFMMDLNWMLDISVFPHDLTTVDGTRNMTDDILQAFTGGTQPIGTGLDDETDKGTSFQLKPEFAETILKQNLPRNLILQLGRGSIGDLLDDYEPCDLLGMASWTDRQFYLEGLLEILEEDAKPNWFHLAPIRPVIVDLDKISTLTELRGITALSRLAGRVMVGNMQKGWGGDYPKLWFLLKMAKTIVGLEAFSNVWQRFAAEKTEFGHRVANSIRGHWGRHVLCAHNAFENAQQRTLGGRLERFARDLLQQDTTKEAGESLGAAASVYHLSITLPDAAFVPLSAWTWTSYSSCGGFGAPTPLSSLVERDWATRDFLTTFLEKAGIGNADTIDAKIVEMIGDGRESENLRDELLGISADPDELVVQQVLKSTPPPAGRLIRPVEGPILEPIANHSWESRYVLNAATVRLDGKVFILYRAFGDDEISRVGLAWTKDGVHIDGRLDDPIFGPGDPTESAGTEDPRVTIIGDDLYMLYTAWDHKIAQIAMASIPVGAFLEHRWDAWKRHGLGFPGLNNKDAVLYPEKFNGRYVIYHRIDPNMWISYLDDLNCPWPRTGQKIVTGPRPGMMWDGIKMGAGAQPIKTTHGWLNIYHGVDYERSYRLGVLFMELDDPSNVIYQSPNPILEPEFDFEIGATGNGDYWVPRVVFTCGAVPAVDKDVIDLDDEILVYYGAADTAIGVAKGRLRELVPVLGDGEF
jgi:predicted GH43/DUF377 family glycosyl hydrolase